MRPAACRSVKPRHRQLPTTTFNITASLAPVPRPLHPTLPRDAAPDVCARALAAAPPPGAAAVSPPTAASSPMPSCQLLKKLLQHQPGAQSPQSSPAAVAAASPSKLVWISATARPCPSRLHAPGLRGHHERFDRPDGLSGWQERRYGRPRLHGAKRQYHITLHARIATDNPPPSSTAT